MQRILETTALFVLLVVIGLRPLVGETYDSAGDPISNALASIANPSPLRTLLFDAAIMFAACTWLLSRGLGRARPYRFTGLEAGTLLLLVAALGSCFVAGNRRLAINGAIDWLCYPLLAMLLVQLLDTPLRRGLLLAVVLASATAQAVECAEQRFVSFSETWTEYERIKDEFWAKQGVAPDSPKAILFEHRLKSAEATGYLSHSNVTGSYLVLCGMAAAGLAISRLGAGREAGKREAGSWEDGAGPRARPPAVEPQRADNRLSPRMALTALLALAILATTALTASRGAMASAAIVAALWPIGVWLGPRFARLRPRVATFALWIVVALGAAGVFGIARASAPGSTLNFRWQYWKASAGMIADHPLFGVGAENFGRHYTRYKTIDSAEEVANPHNLLVQAATSWGLIGLAGLLAMFLGATRAWIVGRGPRNGAPLAKPDRSDRARIVDAARPPGNLAAIIAWSIALALTVHLLRAFLLGTDEPNYLFYATTTCGLAWLAGFVVALPGRRDTGGPHPAILAGALAGLGAFLIHDLINFALFVPGTATTFFAVFALARSSPNSARTVPSPAGAMPPTRAAQVARLALAVGALVAWVVVMFTFVAPVGQCAAWMAGAEDPRLAIADVGGEAYRRDVMYRAAALADPLDPTPLVRLARWWASVSADPKIGSTGLDLATGAVDQALTRDPYEGTLHRLAAQILLIRGRTTSARADYLGAVSHADEARHFYPQDPQVYLLVGETNLALGRWSKEAKALEQAGGAFSEALRLDEARPSWEIIRRFSEKERAEIGEKIREARTALDELKSK